MPRNYWNVTAAKQCIENFVEFVVNSDGTGLSACNRIMRTKCACGLWRLVRNDDGAWKPRAVTVVQAQCGDAWRSLVENDGDTPHTERDGSVGRSIQWWSMKSDPDEDQTAGREWFAWWSGWYCTVRYHCVKALFPNAKFETICPRRTLPMFVTKGALKTVTEKNYGYGLSNGFWTDMLSLFKFGKVCLCGKANLSLNSKAHTMELFGALRAGFSR